MKSQRVPVAPLGPDVLGLPQSAISRARDVAQHLVEGGHLWELGGIQVGYQQLWRWLGDDLVQ